MKNTLKNKKILIIGASSDLAQKLNKKLVQKEAILGLHYNNNLLSVSCYRKFDKIKLFQKKLKTANHCYQLIDDFVQWANGIDILIQLSGGIYRSRHWKEITDTDWTNDLTTNLVTPFFLAQKAIEYMKPNGGKILLTSTSSASHGGGSSSLPYGVSKAGIECIVKRLAKDCAKDNIIINAIAPGFIKTKLHTDKIKMTKKQIKKRIDMIPLGKCGTTQDISNLIMFLISEKSSYITGQTITIDGGDWL